MIWDQVHIGAELALGVLCLPVVLFLVVIGGAWVARDRSQD